MRCRCGARRCSVGPVGAPGAWLSLAQRSHAASCTRYVVFQCASDVWRVSCRLPARRSHPRLRLSARCASQAPAESQLTAVSPLKPYLCSCGRALLESASAGCSTDDIAGAVAQRTKAILNQRTCTCVDDDTAIYVTQPATACY